MATQDEMNADSLLDQLNVLYKLPSVALADSPELETDVENALVTSLQEQQGRESQGLAPTPITGVEQSQPTATRGVNATSIAESSSTKDPVLLEYTTVKNVGEAMIEQNQDQSQDANDTVLNRLDKLSRQVGNISTQNDVVQTSREAGLDQTTAVVKSDAELQVEGTKKAYNLSKEVRDTDVAFQERQRSLDQAAIIAEDRVKNSILNQAGYKADGSKMNPIVSFLAGLTGYSNIEKQNAEAGLNKANNAIALNNQSRKVFNETSASKLSYISDKEYQSLIANTELKAIATIGQYSTEVQAVKAQQMATEFGISVQEVNQWHAVMSDAKSRTAEGARLVSSAYQMYYSAQHQRQQTKELTLNNTAREDMALLWQKAIKSQYGQDIPLKDVNGMIGLITTANLTAEQVMGYATPISGFLLSGANLDDVMYEAANTPIKGEGSRAAQQMVVSSLVPEDAAIYNDILSSAGSAMQAANPIDPKTGAPTGLSQGQMEAAEEHAFGKWYEVRKARLEDPVKFLEAVNVPIRNDVDSNLKGFEQEIVRGDFYTYRDGKKVQATLSKSQLDVIQTITSDGFFANAGSNVERVDAVGAKQMLANMLGMGSGGLFERRASTEGDRAGSIYAKINSGELSIAEIGEAMEVYFSRVIGDQANATSAEGNYGEVVPVGEEAKWMYTPAVITNKNISSKLGAVGGPSVERNASAIATAFNTNFAGRPINLLDPEVIARILTLGNANYLMTQGNP